MTVNMATRKTLMERRLESELRNTRSNMRRQLNAGALSESFEQMKANEKRLKGLLKALRDARKAPKGGQRYVVGLVARLDVEVYANDRAMAISMAREKLDEQMDPTDFYIIGHVDLIGAELNPDPGVE